MATLNRRSNTNAGSTLLTHEGTPAKRITPLHQLRRSVMSCLLWEDTHYEDGVEIASRIAELVTKVGGPQVATTAIEAHTKFKLRHVPLLLVRLLAAGTPEQRREVAEALFQVTRTRPDQMTEFLAIYWKDKKQPLSAQVKKGLARAFAEFNEYQLAKYNRDGAVKLRDVLFLSHAKPKDEAQAALFKKVVDNQLTTPDTWEVALSGGADKKETFTRLIKEKKLGALALLRNLRNMVEARVDEKLIGEAIVNMNTERVLPFRFITAARYAPRFEAQLEQAMFRCLEGAPKLPGKTALIIDTSPSMWMAKVSAKSEMDRFEAAAALAILLRETCADVNIFAFNDKSYDIPARRGFALRDALAKTKDGYSRGGLAVAAANERGYDRIIVLTDGQWHYSEIKKPTSWGGESMDDAKVVSPAPLTEKAYMINVSTERYGVGYGKWTSIDGWSEAIVDYIREFENAGL